ncbi:palmitoyltransferase ZDHHC11 [Pieris brassicae]|uniref:palmitoyltransferase ZDHHC11 n=1 Tax=Pieris brassicae TaxID=7116 RepID=UPI001E6605A5|nr:palmitoyltransferase ZDHHC11 [Pieris brassicae]
MLSLISCARINDDLIRNTLLLCFQAVTKATKFLYSQMGGGHVSNQNPQNLRRINGFQLPLNFLQLFGWMILIGTGLLSFLFFVEIQPQKHKLAALTIYAILYGLHIVIHVIAIGLDPSENEIRKREITEVPEFDRNLHAHVIENGRCHLCNIYTSDKKTKHCGICNKCVYKFDHHCKWLNNCVGGRNYLAFIGCVITALFISVFTLSLCVVDLVIFFTYPLSFEASVSYSINCTSTNVFYIQNCKSSIFFILFLIIYLVCSFVITCALLHLLCFHAYITILGISTYEYIIKNKISPLEIRCLWMPNRKCISNKQKKRETDLIRSEPNVANLVGIIIDSELEKAKNLFNYRKNKVYPTHSTTDNGLESKVQMQTGASPTSLKS